MYRIQFKSQQIWVSYNLAARIVLLVVLALLSAIALHFHSASITVYFSGASQISNLRTLLVTVGGSLIGAAAISFSLIMFAMQINVDRMPHGLFFKFSTDIRVLRHRNGPLTDSDQPLESTP
jgi:uncharacterized membrane protein